MKFDDYIRGARHGKEAHDIELDAMRDPFLNEALDGFDAVPGDHSPALERLAEAVMNSASGGHAAVRVRRSRLRESRIRGWSIAAASIFIVGMVGGGVWLLYNGVPGSESHPTIARESGSSVGYGSQEEVAIMPPVTVIKEDIVPTPATDISTVHLDETEIRTLSDAIATESTIETVPAGPVRDTVVTTEFRQYIRVATAATGTTRAIVRVGFEVGTDGRPRNINVIAESIDGRPVSGETHSVDSVEAAGAAAIKLLEEGPDWPTEPSRKLITITL